MAIQPYVNEAHKEAIGNALEETFDPAGATNKADTKRQAGLKQVSFVPVEPACVLYVALFVLKRSTKEICFRDYRICFMMPLPYCVYILFSHKDHLLYTGYTTNIEERIKSHNDGNTKSTAPRRPLELIFCEFYLFEADARRREMYSKTTAGKKAVKLMLGLTLLKFGYNRTAGIAVINDDKRNDNQ